VLVLVVAVLMVSYASSMRAYLEQRAHLQDLRTNIEQSRANIKELKREKRRWNDPAYVEAQARQRFGYVLPGETGYQVIGEDGEPLSPDDSLTDPDTITQPDRPPWWETAWDTMEAAGNPEDVEVPAGQIGTIKKKNRG
jgi:hypothetical protein